MIIPCYWIILYKDSFISEAFEFTHTGTLMQSVVPKHFHVKDPQIDTLASRPPFGIIQHNPIIGIINCMEQKCIFWSTWSKNVCFVEYK